MAAAVCTVGSVVMLWTGSAAESASPYQTLHVLNESVTIGLPSGWSASAGPASTAFLAYSPERDALVYLSVARTIASSLVSYRASYIAGLRQYYLTRDPQAMVRFRAIGLPAGKGEEAIVMTRGQAAYSYGIRRGDLQYSFTYLCPISELGAYAPLFEHSARTIRIS
jgi:hypothetical protein